MILLCVRFIFYFQIGTAKTTRGVLVGLLDGLVKVANSKGQTDRLARILWLRGH